MGRATSIVKIRMGHSTRHKRTACSQFPSSSRPFRSLACKKQSLFARIVRETLRCQLSWLCALPWSNGGWFLRSSSPNTRSKESSASCSPKTPATSREQVKVNTAALTGITLATMPETKLSHLHNNDQRAANVPAIDTIERYDNFPYRRTCTTGYIRVHTLSVHTSKHRLTYRCAYVCRW